MSLRALSPILLAFGLLGACGTDDPPMGTPMPAACGLPDACHGMDECGSGAANFKEVVFCSNCPSKPDTHVCEACACRQLPIGQGANIVTNVSLPANAVGAKSFALTAVYPIMADGTAVTCEKLLAADSGFLLNNPKLQTGNSNHVPCTGDPNLTYMVRLYDYPGTNHLLLVQAASDTQGKGTVMAKGCASGITVPETGTVTVEVTLH